MSTRAYRYITNRTSPNQNARNRPISGITIHWWGNPVGQKIEGIVSWLCDKRAGTSAHYVVSSGVVYCIVDPDRRAWHAGNARANHTQIGIELDPNASQRAGTMATAAALIKDLRSVYGDLPLYPHKHWTSTACPGNYDLKALDRLARGKTAAPAPAKPAATVKPAIAPPFPLPRRPGALYYYGPADGPITSVSGMGLNTAVPADVYRDAAGRWHSRGLAKWQQRMIDRGWSELAQDGADGRYGKITEKVVGQFQKLVGLPVDRKLGPDTWAAAWSEPVT
ncbi:peptidoglycan recognition protein family protein [Brachybacterium tyrofermentans]|uniref:peptidoglycan recognition protein family protein n=1 Tax=Brachybacterium tyrofermentans TaxID=47848 RepID=UPI003FD601FA